MNAYFHRLFCFNSWANDITSGFLYEHQIDDPDCIKLMSHLLLAQSNWYGRLVGLQEDQPIWQMVELSYLRAEIKKSGDTWLEYIQSLDPTHFNERVHYNNMAGQPQENSVMDLLAHVVNHATYHRGQIARRIRELGFAPPSTDYVLFARIFP